MSHGNVRPAVRDRWGTLSWSHCQSGLPARAPREVTHYETVEEVVTCWSVLSVLQLSTHGLASAMETRTAVTASGARSLANPSGGAGSIASDPSLLPQLKIPLPGAATRPLSSPARQHQQQVEMKPAVFDVEDAEVARLGLEGAPEIQVRESPTKATPVDPEDLTPGLPMKKNAYARAAPDENGPRLVLTKDTMEFELRQMHSFNREVYESRVRQKFLEEALTRKLYDQKIAMRRHERLAKQRHNTDERMRREFALGTPYLQLKAREAQAAAMAEAMRSESAPQFADLKAIDDRISMANLASRNVSVNSRFAKPASVRELAITAKADLPPTHSLMNPRNQITSPLPPKEMLLPWVASRVDESRETSNSTVTKGAAQALLTIIPDLFDAKRDADYDAERRGESRPSFKAVVKAFFAKSVKKEDLGEKMVALRFACAMHNSVPRIAIFQSMMGWGPDRLPWDATKSKACLLLMMWLQPPPDEATKVSKKFVPKDIAKQLIEDTVSLELKLSDVELVLKHLQRKRLVSAKGAMALGDEAEKLVLPRSRSVEREGPSVDVDQLLLKWMSIWGTWDRKEDTDAVLNVLQLFKPRSPTKGLGQGLAGKLGKRPPSTKR